MNQPRACSIAVDELVRITGGRFIGRARTVDFRGACIDSRRVTPACLFACLVGRHVDGHDYAAAAVGNGAALVLASRPVEVPVGVLQCPDVTTALGRIAAWFRNRYQAAEWVGITGSNGKTTVKEMLRAALAARGAVHATAGNLNNELGVPLSVLATPAGMRSVIIEMGASAQGEIDRLAAIVQPDVGVLTGIGPAHLEGFGGLMGVARGKTELLWHCRRCAWVSLCGLDAVAVAHGVEADAIRARVHEAAGSLPLHLLTEEDCLARIRAGDPPRLLQEDGAELPLGMSGTHNAWNALLALHVAEELDVPAADAAAAVAAVEPVSGRLRSIDLGVHRLFDDSYNANPASMAAGLAVLSCQAGARLAVLGGMGELGPSSDRLHRQVGAEAARLGLPLITVGAGGAAIATGYRDAGGRDLAETADKEAALELIDERLAVGPTAILVKASRSAALDEIIAALQAAHGETGECG
ncbi:MAG: UDP-N-acetylmuramoyl-tripeptide--D-alanyl-D-alanine ligase [Planctomycetota bacterium]